jgi:hypothetical protein
MLSLVRSCYFWLGQVSSCYSGCHVSQVYFVLGQIKLVYVRIRKVISVMSGYVRLNPIRSGYVRLLQFISG